MFLVYLCSTIKVIVLTYRKRNIQNEFPRYIKVLEQLVVSSRKGSHQPIKDQLDSYLVEELTKILDTSEALFTKYGIRSVTMSDISKTMGISKKTLYVHIQNKQDLVHRLVQRFVIRDKNYCIQVLGEAPNALEGLLRVNLYMQEQINQINPSLLFDLQKYHHPTWELFIAFHDTFMLELLEQNLRQGVKEGWYRSDLNVTLVARLHVNMMGLTTDSDLFPPKQFAPAEVARVLIQYHIHAIISPKGRAQLDELEKQWFPTSSHP